MITFLVLLGGSLACAWLAFLTRGITIREFPLAYGLITMLYMVSFTLVFLLVLVV